MRLKSLNIENFRSCHRTNLDFSEHLTVLVGENDAGKSNIIDALRASVPPATGRYSRWFSTETDPTLFGVRGEPIVVQRVFTDLTYQEQALYQTALLDPCQSLVHTTTFRTEPELPRRQRLSHTVSFKRVPDPEPENRERIAHVYLPPLRDAVAALDSATGDRLAAIFQVIASPEDIDSFISDANNALRTLAKHKAALKVVAGVQDQLSSVTRPVRHRIVDVIPQEQRLFALARSLRLHMAAEGLKPADLLSSGLGYANLLFIATVILEIEKAREFDLLLLLLEEPEAHLHPQLQNVVLNYLEDQAKQTTKLSDEEAEHTGRIQVIATSHSPHLSASVSVQKIVVVRSHTPSSLQQIASSSVIDQVPAQTVSYATTMAFPLAARLTDDRTRRKIDRYLDATRSTLLFARHLMLVEGVADAVIIRAIGIGILFSDHKDQESDAGVVNRQHREQFRALSVIPIGGVDFQPYLQLLLHNNEPLVDTVVVVTDGDNGLGERRKAAIATKFPNEIQSQRLQVFVGQTTLEAELYAPPQNETLLRAAYKEQHPRSLSKWDEIKNGCQDSPTERARRFEQALQQKTLDLGKGDFAQLVAEAIHEKSEAYDFAVPNYIASAINALLS